MYLCSITSANNNDSSMLCKLVTVYIDVIVFSLILVIKNRHASKITLKEMEVLKKWKAI